MPSITIYRDNHSFVELVDGVYLKIRFDMYGSSLTLFVDRAISSLNNYVSIIHDRRLYDNIYSTLDYARHNPINHHHVYSLQIDLRSFGLQSKYTNYFSGVDHLPGKPIPSIKENKQNNLLLLL